LAELLAEKCLEKVRMLIQSGPIKYSTLLQKTRLPKEQLNLYLEELERRGEIVRFIGESRGGRPPLLFKVKEQPRRRGETVEGRVRVQ
jgi:predicted ArsR family transcriptional regulator